jgi:nitrate/nitrite transport system ATP-binding protein
MTLLEDRYVEIFELTKAYPNPGGEAVNVVEGFNLIVRKGEVVGVIGHSGCGKSTVLTMVAGLTPISSGGIAVAGREIAGPGPDRAVVFQSPCLLPWLPPCRTSNSASIRSIRMPRAGSGSKFANTI